MPKNWLIDANFFFFLKSKGSFSLLMGYERNGAADTYLCSMGLWVLTLGKTIPGLQKRTSHKCAYLTHDKRVTCKTTPAWEAFITLYGGELLKSVCSSLHFHSLMAVNISLTFYADIFSTSMIWRLREKQYCQCLVVESSRYLIGQMFQWGGWQKSIWECKRVTKSN